MKPPTKFTPTALLPRRGAGEFYVVLVAELCHQCDGVTAMRLLTMGMPSSVSIPSRTDGFCSARLVIFVVIFAAGYFAVGSAQSSRGMPIFDGANVSFCSSVISFGWFSRECWCCASVEP